MGVTGTELKFLETDSGESMLKLSPQLWVFLFKEEVLRIKTQQRTKYVN